MKKVPRFTVSKEVRFESAHYLKNLDEDHPCAAMHGHNYVAIVTLSTTQLDQQLGWVFDFRLIGQVVKEAFDHKCLNDVMGSNPTGEAVAYYIARLIMDTLFRFEDDGDVELVSVELWETPNNKVTVTFDVCE